MESRTRAPSSPRRRRSHTHGSWWPPVLLVTAGQAVVSRAVLWGVGSNLAKAVSFHLWYFVPIPRLAVGVFSWYSGFLSALLGNAQCTSAANAFKCLTAMFTEGYISITSQYQVNSGSETAPNGRNLPPASCCRCPGIRQTERTQYHHCMKTNFPWTSQVQEVSLLPKQTRQRATFFQSKEQTSYLRHEQRKVSNNLSACGVWI